MPDPRDWISRLKVVVPPDLWSEVQARSSSAPLDKPTAPAMGGWPSRPGGPRLAALVTGAAAGILALTLVAVGLRGRPTGEDGPTPSPEPTLLSEAHEVLERELSDLWVLEARRAELQGEIGAGQDELDFLLDRLGSDPTEAQLVDIRMWEARIQAWTRSAEQLAAEISALQVRIKQLRAVREEFLPPADASTHPSVASVTCDGDRTGGTHLSTPVVRVQDDGVHFHVVNRISNEEVFLQVGRLDAAIPPGGTREIVMPLRAARDVEVECTFLYPRSSWDRPTHPLWIAPASSEGANPTPSPEVSHLDPLTLQASLDKPPAAWKEVALISVGDAEGEVGVQPCFHCGEQLLPSAIAVDRDGTFWIADSWKARIAHFARDGSFIEAFPAEIGSALPDSTGSADLAFVGDRLYVLFEEGASKVAVVRPDGLSAPILVNHEGRRLDVQAVIPGQDELTVMISGAQRLLGGYWAFATVDPSTGQVTPSPGVQNSTGTFVDLQPSLDGPPATYEIRSFRDGEAITVRELRFQLVQGGKDVRTTVGDAYVRTATHWGVATVMSIGDAQGNPVGKWYLEILPESPPIVFERLPGEGFIGDARRHLTVGPDGDVYWIRLFDDGLHVFRR
jgi:hypothetical protein